MTQGADEDDDAYSDFTTDENRAVQLLGDELVRVVRRFVQKHPSIYVDLRMGVERCRGPQATQMTFFDLILPPSS